MASSGGEFHPNFSSDGDVVLQSSEGTKFRLDSTGLKAASSVFRDMLNFPRDPNEAADAPVVLSEDAKTLSFIFNYIYPTPSSTDLKNYEEVWKVVEASGKYDIPSVLKILRMYLISEDRLRQDALNLFAVASQCGWQDVLRSSSTSSLERNISLSKNVPILKKAKPDDVLALLDLHWRRKEALVDVISFGEEYTLVSFDQFGHFFLSCKRCNSQINKGGVLGCEDEKAVEVFQTQVKNYIDRCPLAPDLWRREFWEKTVGGIAAHRCNGCNRDVFNIDEAIMWLDDTKAAGGFPLAIGDTNGL